MARQDGTRRPELIFLFSASGGLYRLAYECRLWVHLKCFHKHTTIAALAHGT